MPQAAILTGDLIGSTPAGPEALAEAMAEIAALPAWTEEMPPRFTRFRGDGWQMAAPAHLGPRTALAVMARLRARGGLQSRIALAIGDVVDWGGADLSRAHGMALTASGRALDGMGKARLVLAGGRETDTALALLCAALAEGWTPPQAEVLALALQPHPLPQSGMARALGISAQAVSLRMRGARAGALLAALDLWEADLARRFPPEAAA